VFHYQTNNDYFPCCIGHWVFEKGKQCVFYDEINDLFTYYSSECQALKGSFLIYRSKAMDTVPSTEDVIHTT
jgi:hypothetical protein